MLCVIFPKFKKLIGKFSNIVFALVLTQTPKLSGQFSATYGFVDVSTASGTLDPSPSPTLTGMNFSSFSAHGVSQNPTAISRFSFTGWPGGATDSNDDFASFNGDLSGLSYYEVCLKPAPFYTLDINSINFHVRRSGSGIRNYSVRSSLDNFSSNLAASTGTNTKLGVLPSNIFFWKYDSISTSSDQRGSYISLGSEFDAIADSVVFRFYAWNAESVGGSFSIDNVNFNGLVYDSSIFLSVSENTKQEIFDAWWFDPEKRILKTRKSQLCEELIIYSVLGKELLRIENPAKEIPVLELPDGVYLTRIRNGGS